MVDFSIITVVKFAVSTIRRNIKSVSSQIYKNYEHIIVCHEDDLESRIIIRKLKKKNKIKLIISRDKSLYEAMNIGIKRAKGDFITFLNADDIFKNSKVLKNVIDNIKIFPKIKSFYGNIEIMKNKKIYRKWNSGAYLRSKFFCGWHPPHPSMFIKKFVFDKYGYFDTKFKLAADYELMIRLFVVNSLSSRYISKTLIEMNHGGLSSKNMKNIILSNIEAYLSWKKNGYSFFIFIFFTKPLSKIFQFIIK